MPATAARGQNRPTLLLILTLLWSTPAFSWWDAGHQMVCEMALEQVKEATRQHVHSLVAGDFPALCDWPDRIKGERPGTRSWHYLNSRPDTRRIADLPRPPEGDVVTALVTQARLLRGGGSLQQRREALLWVGHLVGDLHQPMHLGYFEDLGGNRYRLALPEALAVALGEDRDSVNMHAVWDGLILRYHSGDPQPFASDAVTTPAVIDLEAAVLSWADETLQVLNRAETRYRDPPRLQTLERSYLEDNGPAVRLQLRRAAGRLAALLDWALSPTED